MGVIIKYQLVFPEADLKVSNDLYAGEFIIDADITAEMMRGTTGCKFEIKLYDLPKKKVKELYNKHQEGDLHVVINLGYFDGPFGTVMEGVVDKIHISIDSDKLVAVVKGFEIGTHAVRETRFEDIKSTLEGVSTITDAVKKLLEKVKGDIDRTPKLEENISDEFTDKTLRGENLIEVLDQIAEIAKAEFLVCDKTVRMGKPIMNNSYQPPPTFQPGTSLAIFRPFIKEIPDKEGLNILEPLKATQAQGFEFTVSGDPKLRPAHKVVAGVEDYDESSGAEFRIHWVIHQLTTSGGYICKGVAVKVCLDNDCRRQETAIRAPRAEMIAQSLAQRIQSEQRRSPTVEVGKIKTYQPEKNISTLYYRQRFRQAETQPSIRVEVDTDEQQLFPNKPMVSPFAWHKCGLVVPVYPGMKAVLNHNLNLQDDALVAGFIWSQQPLFEPPKNKEGDWWLCLPIDFDSSQSPTDSTKAANDLIANNGKRVIEVKGLKITIGNDKLQNVGIRPSEGEDNEFLIEHAKAKIKISSDGSIEMTADANGGVTLKLNKSSVEIA